MNLPNKMETRVWAHLLSGKETPCLVLSTPRGFVSLPLVLSSYGPPLALCDDGIGGDGGKPINSQMNITICNLKKKKKKKKKKKLILI